MLQQSHSITMQRRKRENEMESNFEEDFCLFLSPIFQPEMHFGLQFDDDNYLRQQITTIIQSNQTQLYGHNVVPNCIFC